MSAVDSVLKIIFGDKSKNDIKRILPIVEKVNSHEAAMKSLSDEALSAKSNEFRARLKDILGVEPAGLDLSKPEEKKRLLSALNDILPEAFAAVREASRRTTGMRHFDMQMVGGIVLHEGKISEMRTGEGKTLVATLPVYLNALTGLGVHVVTVNDYLAKRDADWMGPIYTMLGLTVDVIDKSQPHSPDRRAAYRADITYGTNSEFGFDYLRDNMVMRSDDKVQRPYYYAIVDEVDSILIDEARTPLIISGPAEKNVKLYYEIDKIIPTLKEAQVDNRKNEIPGSGDYVVDEKDKNAYLTEQGVATVEKLLGLENLYGSRSVDVVHHVNQALKAHKLFKHDVDYVVQDGQVLIVDEFTGRILEGRRYSDGLHQAIEAKERVAIQNESQTYATVTYQNYFRMYHKLAGMTGTAETEAEEFVKIYNLDVIAIPPNKNVIRKDLSDRIYRTRKAKFDALAAYVKTLQDTGKPVLVGTISVEMNETLAAVFRKHGVKFEMLNAKNHAREAKIVAVAGEPGSVTLATNMAGRGTDIVLGGNPIEKGMSEVEQVLTVLKNHAFKEKDPRKKEALTKKIASIETHKEAFVRSIIADKIEEATELARRTESEDLLAKLDTIVGIREKCKRDKEIVVANGGLHVVGSERHEARRIDNQLRGRSGRQGDPGLSVFYISLEDDLMRLFGSERIAKMMIAMGMKEEEELEHPWMNSSIERAQRKVEGRNFDIRKHLLEYDDVMNQQRISIYAERNNILFSDSIRPRVEEIIDEALEASLEEVCPSDARGKWDKDAFRRWLETAYLLKLDDSTVDELMAKSHDDLLAVLRERMRKHYDAKVNEVNPKFFAMAERHIFLQILDNRWKEHLFMMDSLREGIGLRGYAERNPLTEYKLEGFRMFAAMVGSMKRELSEILFHVRISTDQFADDTPESALAGGVESKSEMGSFDALRSSPDAPPAAGPQASPAPAVRNQAIAGRKIGRNEPCPCGSGKKYKLCHGKDA